MSGLPIRHRESLDELYALYQRFPDVFQKSMDDKICIDDNDILIEPTQCNCEFLGVDIDDSPCCTHTGIKWDGKRFICPLYPDRDDWVIPECCDSGASMMWFCPDSAIESLIDLLDYVSYLEDFHDTGGIGGIREMFRKERNI